MISRLRPCLVAVGVAVAMLQTQPVGAQQAQQQPQQQGKPKAGGKPAAPPPIGADPTYRPTLEPKAVALLNEMGATLAAAKTMSFRAVVSYEYPSRLGPPIVYTTRYDVTMRRPDRLKVIQAGDGPMSEFIYDGKTVTAYAPAENLAARADAPPTIEAALHQAYEKAGIYYPFTDLILPNPAGILSDGAILAFFIGQSTVVGGVKTDMVAWANADVFLQIWIGAEDKLPRRVRAIYRDDPVRLRHDMVLSDWKLDEPLADETFVSPAATKAMPMPFDNPATATAASAAPTPRPRGPHAKPGGKSP